MQHHHTGSRPRVQGLGRALVQHSARNLTDGDGLVLVRKLFDRFALAGWLDCRAKREKGFFRPSLMTAAWIVLLFYGGRVMDDLSLLERRGVRRIFGWIRVPDATTFGRWLRQASERMIRFSDELLWRMARQRWALAGWQTKGRGALSALRPGLRFHPLNPELSRPDPLDRSRRVGSAGPPPSTALRPGSASALGWPWRNPHGRQRLGRPMPCPSEGQFRVPPPLTCPEHAPIGVGSVKRLAPALRP